MYIKKKPSTLEKKIEHYFLPFASQIELLIIAGILFSSICLIFIQALMGVNEEAQVYFNKAIQYEGVIQLEERLEIKATLQRP